MRRSSPPSTGSRRRSDGAVPNAWCDSGLSGRLWPIHLKPYDDELLSSWLVRLSRAYGVDPKRFCASGWCQPAFWNRDIDKGIYDDVLQVLADKTATPPVRVLDTTL